MTDSAFKITKFVLKLQNLQQNKHYHSKHAQSILRRFYVLRYQKCILPTLIFILTGNPLIF